MSKFKTLLLIKGISSAFVLGMMLTLIGCSNESVLDSQDNEYKSESLTIRELMEFNQSLEDMTRSEQSEELMKILKVPLSDAKGAYEGAKLGIQVAAELTDVSYKVGATAGGAVIGATTSFDQYVLSLNSFNHLSDIEMIDKQNQSAAESTSNDSGLPIESEVADIFFEAAYAYSKSHIVEEDYALGLSYGYIERDCIRVGILHNHILRYLHRVFQDRDPGSIWNSLTDEEKQILGSPSFIQGRNRIRAAFGYPTVTYVSNSDEVMNLFVDAILNGGINITEVDKIIKQYMSSVRKSQDLSNHDKEALYCGFIVMAYSYKFWAPYFNLK